MGCTHLVFYFPNLLSFNLSFGLSVFQSLLWSLCLSPTPFSGKCPIVTWLFLITFVCFSSLHFYFFMSLFPPFSFFLSSFLSFLALNTLVPVSLQCVVFDCSDLYSGRWMLDLLSIFFFLPFFGFHCVGHSKCRLNWLKVISWNDSILFHLLSKEVRF